MRRLAAVVALLLAALLSLGVVWQHGRVTMDAATAIASGWCTGWMCQGSTVAKFGFNDDLDSAEESIWDVQELGGPARCFTIMGTTPQAVYLSSDDENDASDNNAVSVTVEYLDSTWAAQTLVVALGAAVASGTTSVQISGGTILRINRMFATTTAAVGNVYASIDADSGVDGVPDDPANQIVAGITIGRNQTLQACFTVELGSNALMKAYTVGNDSNVGTIRFELRRSIEGGASRTTELHPVGANTPLQVLHPVPIVFVEKTDIEITGTGVSPNNDASATFGLLILPEAL